MSALGLNIGVFSNLPVIDRISCLSYLFASTNTYEQNTVSVWDLSQDKWCVKARVWDYLKILHGKSVGSTNPVDNINYRISSLEHFFLMGDETEMKDTNFLILNEKKEYTSEESESIVAFSDKIISKFHAEHAFYIGLLAGLELYKKQGKVLTLKNSAQHNTPDRK